MLDMTSKSESHMRIMKYDLKVPILCRSRFHNRIYSLSCAKICYTDPQHDIWLLHRILDHMTPWISFYFSREDRFGAIVASKLLCYKLVILLLHSWVQSTREF